MNNFINLAHLKFFCDAVTYQSISDAAKKNFISQPAVSHAIKRLENIFGLPLLVHNKQKVVPTEQGMIVFNQATEIFKSVKNTFVKIDETRDVLAGNVHFATTKSLGMSFFPGTYRKMRENLPFVNAAIKMGGVNVIRTALRREEVDFAIVVYDHHFSQFAKHPIKKGRFNLYYADNAPRDLIDQGVFVDNDLGSFVPQLAQFLSEQHASCKINSLSGWELVANFANLGIGVGFFPDYLASATRFPLLTLHPTELPPFEYEIAAIYNKANQLSKAARAFIDQFTLG
jgi:DNA-binding transcriptional LysR family regulator